jgi:hypothetical protein
MCGTKKYRRFELNQLVPAWYSLGLETLGRPGKALRPMVAEEGFEPRDKDYDFSAPTCSIRAHGVRTEGN